MLNLANPVFADVEQSARLIAGRNYYTIAFALPTSTQPRIEAEKFRYKLYTMYHECRSVPYKPELRPTPEIFSRHVPPAKCGFVRLDRGEHPTEHNCERFGFGTPGVMGGWFTCHLDSANWYWLRHGSGAHIVYVDVPPDLFQERLIKNFPALLRKRPGKESSSAFFLKSGS